MKKQLILIILMALSLTVNAQFVSQKTNTNPGDDNFPVMTFENTKHDFGTLHEGDVVTYVYKFQNTGKSPLIINRIKASCGCTVPSNWKKAPIMPGEKSEFTVKFNTRNKIHKQHKTVTVYCNTKNKTERVFFTADVIPNPKMEKQREERRKRWALERKQRLKNKKTPKKPYKRTLKNPAVKLTFEQKDKIMTNKISLTKLKVKELKLEQKLERKIHKKAYSKEKIAKTRQKISRLDQQIEMLEIANEKIKSGKK